MITVEVIVPGNESIFEVNIPTHITFHELTGMLIKATSGLAKEDYNPVGAILCDAQSGRVYDINVTIEQEGLINGSKLLLI